MIGDEAYLPTLEDRLCWAHEPSRAAHILAGLDERTNADLAAWKRLCDRSNWTEADTSSWTGIAIDITQRAMLDLRN